MTMIAHGLSTIREASRVVVMDQGCIVEIDSHDELLGRRSLYFNLYTTQFYAETAGAVDKGVLHHVEHWKSRKPRRVSVCEHHGNAISAKEVATFYMYVLLDEPLWRK